MKVLVTGGAGFIGSHVVELLVDRGYDVTVIDHLQSGSKQCVPSGVMLYEDDITENGLETVFNREKPDYVVHLAAQVDVGRSLRDPAYDARTNILGTIHLLDCCRKYTVRKIVYSSSCAVYGETEDISIIESTPARPISFYGISKYAPEIYITLYHKLFGLPFTILRYANVYGPRQEGKGEGGVVSVFINTLKDGRPLTIFGDGEQTRDFVYVKDVASANLLSLTHGSNEVVHIGTGTRTSINRLFQKIAAAMSLSVTPVYLPPRPGDIRHSRLNRDKAERLLGWSPAYDLERGIEETVQYCMK